MLKPGQCEELLECLARAHECVLKYTACLMDADDDVTGDYMRLIVSLETIHNKLSPDKKLFAHIPEDYDF